MSVSRLCESCIIYHFMTTWPWTRKIHTSVHTLPVFLPRGKFVYFFKMCSVVSEIYTTIFFAPGVRQSTETKLVTIRKMYTSDSACCNLPESKQDSCLFPWCHNFIKSLAIVTEEKLWFVTFKCGFFFPKKFSGTFNACCKKQLS